jgi:hypothetical protein
MLKAMRLAALLTLAAALPCAADTHFQVKRMTHADAPAGRGQCDIRLEVNGEAEVQVKGDAVIARTISGEDARDDGSECSAPLPERDIRDFRYEVREGRGEILLMDQPSRRNRVTVTVRIRDGAGGFGRYHFRLTWSIAPPASSFDLPREGAGLAWNNATSYTGKGRGEAVLNGFGRTSLGEVNIAIDRTGKLAAMFRVEHESPLAFNGDVIGRDEGRWKASVASGDGRLRGPMWFTVDARGIVSTVTVEATDGRDRLKVSWARR